MEAIGISDRHREHDVLVSKYTNNRDRDSKGLIMYMQFIKDLKSLDDGRVEMKRLIRMIYNKYLDGKVTMEEKLKKFADEDGKITRVGS